MQGSVYMIAGAGGNITVQVGDDGVLVVDTGAAPMSDKVVAAIRKLSDKPIHLILNTDADPDHTGGNASLAKAGSRIGTQMVAAALAGEGAAIVAHEKVLNALSAPTGKQAAAPAIAWPTDTYFADTRNLFFNNEAIQMFHPPAAHSDGDSMVVLPALGCRQHRRHLRLHAGIRSSTPANGGSFRACSRPSTASSISPFRRTGRRAARWSFRDTAACATSPTSSEYRDMLTIVRDRIQDLIKKGMTLEQVKAARPTLDYDGRYGATTGPWTTEMFVEAAYRELSRR